MKIKKFDTEHNIRFPQTYFYTDTYYFKGASIHLIGYAADIWEDVRYDVFEKAEIKLDLDLFHYLILRLCDLWSGDLCYSFLSKYQDKYEENDTYNTDFDTVERGNLIAKVKELGGNSHTLNGKSIQRMIQHLVAHGFKDDYVRDTPYSFKENAYAKLELQNLIVSKN